MHTIKFGNKAFWQFIALSMVAFIVQACVTDDDPTDAWALTVGDSLPGFSVTLNTGQSISATSLKGKISVIVLFNTSCPDCRKEFPVIQQLYDKLANDDDVVIFGIARAEEKESISKYWNENGLTFPWSPQSDRTVYNLFAESIIPRLYIADKKGTITASFGDTDIPTLETLEAAIKLAGLN